MNRKLCIDCGKCLPCTAWIDLPFCIKTGELAEQEAGEAIFSEEAQRKMHQIKNCVHCNRCVKLCPQEINIPGQMIEDLKCYQEYAGKKQISLTLI